MTVVHVNNENFQKEVNESKTPVVVDFWAEWCGPCRMMGPVFEDLAKEFEGKLKFAKLNTEEEPELTGQFGIRGIPTLIVMKGGKQVESLVGYRPKDVLKNDLSKVLAKI